MGTNLIELLRRVIRAGKVAEDAIHETLEDFPGLSFRGFIILDVAAQTHPNGVAIYDINDYSIVDVAESRGVQELIEHPDYHVIVRKTDPEDRRRKLVKATTEGLQLHEAIRDKIWERIKERAGPLSNSDLSELNLLLAGFGRNI